MVNSYIIETFVLALLIISGIEIMIFCMYIADKYSLNHVPNRLLTDILDNSFDWFDNGLICYDDYGRCIYYNTKAKNIYGITEENNRGEELYNEWVDGVTVDKFSGQPVWVNNSGDGNKPEYEVKFKPIVKGKDDYIGCYFIITDVPQTFNINEKEQFTATHDALTYTYNREAFFDKVRSTLNKEPDIERYMLVTDIRDFGKVNMLYGTQRGDSLLMCTAEALRKCITKDSIIGRIGSDRFAICIKKKDYSPEQFESAMSELSRMASTSSYNMHTHIGVYKIVNTSMDITAMCNNAVTAIQRNKNNTDIITCYSGNEPCIDLL